MMVRPPIDKLITKLECKYALCCLVSKRARYLLDKRPADLDGSQEKAISCAAQEIYDGKVIAVKD